MNYSAGVEHSGATYSFGNVYGLGFLLNAIQNAVPSFPSMDGTGPWLQTTPLYFLYSIYPELQYNSGNQAPTPLPLGFATESGDSSVVAHGNQSNGVMLNPVFTQNPASDNAQYLRYFLEKIMPFSLWGSFGLVQLLGNVCASPQRPEDRE